MKLADLTWMEVEGKDKIVVPVGSIEQHGPHLPLNTDMLIAKAVSGKIASQLDAIVAPSITPGVSVEHMDFPGTISLSEEVFTWKIKDICSSLIQNGFKEIILVNGHGGNSKSLESLKLPGVRYLDVIKQLKGYDHAGEIETSLMLYLHPSKVRKDKIKKHDFILPEKIGWRTIEHSKTGVLGDPTNASRIKGKEYFKQIISQLMEELENEC